jgi:hypothetical protein
VQGRCTVVGASARVDQGPLLSLFAVSALTCMRVQCTHYGVLLQSSHRQVVTTGANSHICNSEDRHTTGCQDCWRMSHHELCKTPH